jgi:hypothetical protein
LIFGIGTIGNTFFFSEALIARVTGVAFLASLSLVYLLAFIHSFFQPIRDASFYENHFILRGGKEQREFAYTEVESASLTKLPTIRVFPLLDLRNQIILSIKGESSSVIIPANPENKQLKTDLYSWLISKTTITPPSRKIESTS